MSSEPSSQHDEQFSASVTIELPDANDFSSLACSEDILEVVNLQAKNDISHFRLKAPGYNLYKTSYTSPFISSFVLPPGSKLYTGPVAANQTQPGYLVIPPEYSPTEVSLALENSVYQSSPTTISYKQHSDVTSPSTTTTTVTETSSSVVSSISSSSSSSSHISSISSHSPSFISSSPPLDHCPQHFYYNQYAANNYSVFGQGSSANNIGKIQPIIGLNVPTVVHTPNIPSPPPSPAPFLSIIAGYLPAFFVFTGLSSYYYKRSLHHETSSFLHTISSPQAATTTSGSSFFSPQRFSSSLSTLLRPFFTKYTLSLSLAMSFIDVPLSMYITHWGLVSWRTKMILDNNYGSTEMTDNSNQRDVNLTSRIISPLIVSHSHPRFNIHPSSLAYSGTASLNISEVMQHLQSEDDNNIASATTDLATTMSSETTNKNDLVLKLKMAFVSLFMSGYSMSQNEDISSDNIDIVDNDNATTNKKQKMTLGQLKTKIINIFSPSSCSNDVRKALRENIDNQHSTLCNVAVDVPSALPLHSNYLFDVYNSRGNIIYAKNGQEVTPEQAKLDAAKENKQQKNRFFWLNYLPQWCSSITKNHVIGCSGLLVSSFVISRITTGIAGVLFSRMCNKSSIVIRNMSLEHVKKNNISLITPSYVNLICSEQLNGVYLPALQKLSNISKARIICASLWTTYLFKICEQEEQLILEKKNKFKLSNIKLYDLSQYPEFEHSYYIHKNRMQRYAELKEELQKKNNSKNSLENTNNTADCDDNDDDDDTNDKNSTSPDEENFNDETLELLRQLELLGAQLEQQLPNHDSNGLINIKSPINSSVSSGDSVSPDQLPTISLDSDQHNQYYTFIKRYIKALCQGTRLQNNVIQQLQQLWVPKTPSDETINQLHESITDYAQKHSLTIHHGDLDGREPLSLNIWSDNDILPDPILYDTKQPMSSLVTAIRDRYRQYISQNTSIGQISSTKDEQTGTIISPRSNWQFLDIFQEQKYSFSPLQQVLSCLFTPTWEQRAILPSSNTPSDITKQVLNQELATLGVDASIPSNTISFLSLIDQTTHALYKNIGYLNIFAVFLAYGAIQWNSAKTAQSQPGDSPGINKYTHFSVKPQNTYQLSKNIALTTRFKKLMPMLYNFQETKTMLKHGVLTLFTNLKTIKFTRPKFIHFWIFLVVAYYASFWNVKQLEIVDNIYIGEQQKKLVFPDGRTGVIDSQFDNQTLVSYDPTAPHNIKLQLEREREKIRTTKQKFQEENRKKRVSFFGQQSATTWQRLFGSTKNKNNEEDENEKNFAQIESRLASDVDANGELIVASRERFIKWLRYWKHIALGKLYHEPISSERRFFSHANNIQSSLAACPSGELLPLIKEYERKLGIYGDNSVSATTDENGNPTNSNDGITANKSSTPSSSSSSRPPPSFKFLHRLNNSNSFMLLDQQTMHIELDNVYKQLNKIYAQNGHIPTILDTPLDDTEESDDSKFNGVPLYLVTSPL